MVKRKLLYKKLLDYAKKNPDGFTIKITKGTIKGISPNKLNRYVVGITNNNTPSKIKQSFRDNNFTGTASGWLDKKTGKYYINKNKIFPDTNKGKQKALKLGKQKDQLEIFDWHEFDNIKLQKKHGEHKEKQRKMF
ncbi:unnamed protein product [marine sediment metagenome]|uniref:Uncharacterized protein n=1 Tax=marine sediment metagenome TaxID=412755 RepID=X1APN0_9ZZZZ